MVNIDTGAVKVVLKQSLAFASKEISQQLRFKFDYLANLFITPLINFGLFSTVFFGFLRGSGSSFSGLSFSNFISFAVLGTLAASIFNQSFQSFAFKFANEKYWQTAPMLLASPLSPWAILLGTAVADGLGNLVVMAFFLSVAYLALPVGVASLISVVVLYALLYVMAAGVSIIKGAVFLVNENLSPIFGYFMLGTAYVSCFYYPVSFLPSFFKFFAMINPVFYIIDSIRSLWLGSSVSITYVVIAVLVTVLTTTVGTYLFSKIWRNLDISGY